CSAQIGVARVSFDAPSVDKEKMAGITPGSTNTNPGAANVSASAQCQPQTYIAPKNAPIVIGNVKRKKILCHARFPHSRRPFARWRRRKKRRERVCRLHISWRLPD